MHLKSLHKMNSTFTCQNCGAEKARNPRIKKGQYYCGLRECQKARILFWKRQKYASSPVYREKCRKWQKEWRTHRPAYGYQQEYRLKHPDYSQRNRELQIKRNTRNRHFCREDYIQKIVNSNALIGNQSNDSAYLFIPVKFQKIVNSNALSFTIHIQR